MDLLKSTSSISILLTSYSNMPTYTIQIQYAYISQKKIQSQLGSPTYMYNHFMLCTLHYGLSWVVLYVRTWSFSIASKRAQDHQNRSPDVKVMHVSVLGFLLFFWWPDIRDLAGCPGFRVTRDVRDPLGNPARKFQNLFSNVGCARRMSGTFPDVRPLPGCPARCCHLLTNG